MGRTGRTGRTEEREYGKTGGAVSLPPFPPFLPFPIRTHRHSWRHRCLIALAGPDPMDLSHVEDEDLSVPDLACLGALKDGVHSDVDEGVRDADLQADLLLQIDFHRGASICLHVLRL